MNRPSFKPSRQQNTIFDFIRAGEGDALIRATAGAGKTTTLKEVSKLIPKHLRVCFLAYNKAICEELERKLPSTNILTVHSLGRRALSRYLKSQRLKVKTKKDKQILLVNELVEEVLKEHPSANKYETKNFAKELLRLSRLNCADLADLKQLRHISLKYNLRPADDPRVDQTIFIKLQKLHSEIIKQFEKSGIIDFDDMVCLPAELRLPVEQFDFICVDEAQDFSKASLSLVLKARAPNGRMLFVGDARQAINGFAGAAPDSLDVIVDKTKAIEFPLSVTFRCPKLHVQLAKKIAPEIESQKNAKVGTVRVIKRKTLHKWVRQNNLIICRHKLPLVKTCVELNRRGKPASILGIDIGDRLIQIAKHIFRNSLANWQNRLEKYIEDENQRLNKIQNEAQRNALLIKLNDNTNCVRALIEDVENQSKSVSMRLFEQHIKLTFVEDPNNQIVLSTIHKAKGREADRVFILFPHLMSAEYAATTEAVRGEACVQFVALTRSKRDLFFVERNGSVVQNLLDDMLTGNKG